VKLGVFIERDGILNEVRVEGQYQVSPLTLEDLRPIESNMPLLSKLKAAGYVLIVTTNQPGLSRGYQSRRELDRIHARLRALFPVDDILVCPHDETDRCTCRKPKPGLLTEAGFRFRLNLDQSCVVSDKWQDAEAARAASCTSILLESKWTGNVHRDFLVTDFASAVDKILNLRNVHLRLALA
jgi:D-glycero-D-manno-heptose 1,7-bisphosphate phosphatase